MIGSAACRGGSIDVVILGLENLARASTYGGAIENVGVDLPGGINLEKSSNVWNAAGLRRAVDVSVGVWG
jgi:hypothetical protein